MTGPNGVRPSAWGISFAVKTALPRLAEMAQQKAAAAIYRYPRTECDLDLDSGIFLLGDQLFQALWIEADHDLFTHDDGRRGAAIVFAHQLAHRAAIAAYIAQLEWNASLREEGFRPIARRSTGLAI